MGLHYEQIQTLIVIERTTASISVVATLSLMTTFIFIKGFRTLSNTLIFYASFANLFANVAALIGGSALRNTRGALCQFQAFLLQMFMQSDPLWSCAMAVNVYLVFFRRYDAARLKKLYWYYGALCYGLPFIPAIFFVFYKNDDNGKMYGNATLWCWISNQWAPVRIYSYYAPIWAAILATFMIYVRVGVEIFQKRSELYDAANDPNCASATMASSTDQDKTPIFLPPIPPFSGLRTTEIQVTNDPWTSQYDTTTPSFSRSGSEKPPSPQDLYSITIVSSPPPTKPPHTNHYNLTRQYPAQIPSQGAVTKRPSSIDKIKWAYTRCALLFAISILITWVPASINRVHGVRYPGYPSFALNIGSAIVLPLQGFWNAVIYFATSKSVWGEWVERSLRKFRGSKANSWEGKSVHLGRRREGGEGGVGVGGGGALGGGRKGDSTLELSNRSSAGSMVHSL
ncbi:related to G protein coupled receptor like protein [Rhynchosporium graminicola]|uniref:Related to G protein coupled receptor like protein n=1 Tax=Rhynchosporium graminicola TaxID=2792576 RepID=A0A1E1LKP1_9HELO|nr:related to G protein coupled receptor like protein [Rhynchosporium commune]